MREEFNFFVVIFFARKRIKNKTQNFNSKINKFNYIFEISLGTIAYRRDLYEIKRF